MSTFFPAACSVPQAPSRAMTAGRSLPGLRQQGGTFVGFVIGLVVGLVIAVTVALFVTRAPIPFANKVGRAPAPLEAPADPTKLPDPNKPLYPKEATKAEGTTEPAKAEAGKSEPARTEPKAEARTDTKADAKGGAPVVDKSAAAPAPAEAQEIKPSFLQAGAFKSPDEADNMRARLALLGFEARITLADGNSGLHRVRIGPYNRAEDLARARTRLTENGIQPTVVPAGK